MKRALGRGVDQAWGIHYCEKLVHASPRDTALEFRLLLFLMPSTSHNLDNEGEHHPLTLKFWESPKLDFNHTRRAMSRTHPPEAAANVVASPSNPLKFLGIFSHPQVYLIITGKQNLCEISVLQNGSMTISVPVIFFPPKMPQVRQHVLR